MKNRSITIRANQPWLRTRRPMTASACALYIDANPGATLHDALVAHALAPLPALPRLHPENWQRSAGAYTQRDRAWIVRGTAGTKSWTLFVDGIERGSWTSLAAAKAGARAYEEKESNEE